MLLNWMARSHRLMATYIRNQVRLSFLIRSIRSTEGWKFRLAWTEMNTKAWLKDVRNSRSLLGCATPPHSKEKYVCFYPKLHSLGSEMRGEAGFLCIWWLQPPCLSIVSELTIAPSLKIDTSITSGRRRSACREGGQHWVVGYASQSGRIE